MFLVELLMTPERQQTIRLFLGQLSGQFEPRIKREEIDDIDTTLTWLQEVVEGARPLSDMFDEIGLTSGVERKEVAERFVAASAAMTIATYLSRVEIE